MKVAVILGTRPNFIKHYSFNRACKDKGVDLFTIHTGQHYDVDMSDVFFRELKIPTPDYVHDLDRTTPAHEVADMLVHIETILASEQPDVTVVFGDVTSTMAAAQASAMLGIPVAHIESGVRTSMTYNREEIHRRTAEALADVLFPHIQDSYDCLMREGVAPERAVLSGDIVKDSLMQAISEFEIDVLDGDYVYVSVHRAENTDDVERLTAICDALIEYDGNLKFPVHIRTQKALERFELLERLKECDHIELLPPLGFVDNVSLIAGSERVLSDSGGVRREAYILGKPVVSLIDLIWVPSMVEAGWEHIAGADKAKILYGLEIFVPPKDRPPLFGDGRAGYKIVDELLRRYGKETQREAVTNVGIRNQNSLTGRRVAERLARSGLVPDRKNGARTIVSIVIPCYNEQDSLPTLFFRLDATQKLVDTQLYRLEFVLIDDGSADKTAAMLTAYAEENPNVKLVLGKKNRGYGGALKQGFKAASGDIFVTVDADTNYDVRETPRLLEALDQDTDFVTGSPFMSEGGWNYPLHRFVMSRGVVSLYRFALAKKAHDIRTITCCFRAIRRRCVDVVIPDADDFLATAEILIRALMSDFRVKQIPMTIEPRQFGVSKLPTFQMIRRHLLFVWQICTKKVKIRELGAQAGSSGPPK